jgi:hypothetical protein
MPGLSALLRSPFFPSAPSANSGWAESVPSRTSPLAPHRKEAGANDVYSDVAPVSYWQPGVKLAGDVIPRNLRPWESGQAGLGFGGGGPGLTRGPTPDAWNAGGHGGANAGSASMQSRAFGGPAIAFPPDIIPGTPEWWEHAKRGHQGLWDFLLHLRRGVGAGLGGGGQDEDCRKEWAEAREACAKAYAEGWRGDYGAEPYRKPGKGPWSIHDCMRGRVSQRCGGNRVDEVD